MTSTPGAHLRGRVAVVAGDGGEVVPVCRLLLTHGVSLLVVAPDRDAVQQSVAEVNDPSLTVVPITADPTSSGAWDRLVPHAEQRLGPIDIAVAIGSRAVRDLTHDRLVSDMLRRGHGVFVESDVDIVPRSMPDSIRYAALARSGDHHQLATEILTVAAG